MSFTSPGQINPHRGFNWLFADQGVPSTDPLFGLVALLTHFDTVPGLLVDSSSNAFILTQNNVLRPAGLGVPKWGDASCDPTLSVPQDLSGLLTPLSTAFAQNAGVAFTWEFWMRVVTAPPVFNVQMLTVQRADTTDSTRVIINVDGTVTGLLWGSLVTYSAASVVGTGWNFYAGSVQGGQARTYFNGVRVTDTAGGVPDEPGVAKQVVIGRANGAGTGTGSWQVDELRITIGGTDPRYTGPTCPVPTGPFPNG